MPYPLCLLCPISQKIMLPYFLVTVKMIEIMPFVYLEPPNTRVVVSCAKIHMPGPII